MARINYSKARQRTLIREKGFEPIDGGGCPFGLPPIGTEESSPDPKKYHFDPATERLLEVRCPECLHREIIAVKLDRLQQSFRCTKCNTRVIA